jgi:hypothetical protein
MLALHLLRFGEERWIPGIIPSSVASPEQIPNAPWIENEQDAHWSSLMSHTQLFEIADIRVPECIDIPSPEDRTRFS